MLTATLPTPSRPVSSDRAPSYTTVPQCANALSSRPVSYDRAPSYTTVPQIPMMDAPSMPVPHDCAPLYTAEPQIVIMDAPSSPVHHDCAPLYTTEPQIVIMDAPSRPVHHDCAPLYTTEPQFSMVNARYLPSGVFVKESKCGRIILRLGSQEDNVILPIYGFRSHVEGTIELPNSGPVERVEVKIEGRLLLQEIAGSGTAFANLHIYSMLLWSKDNSDAQCPHSLPFSIPLPDTFTCVGVTYPLPPSFDVKLPDLPRFLTTIEYSVAAMVTMPLQVSIPILGIHSGTTIVSTKFIYYPRSRPTKPLPAPLQYLPTVFEPFTATSEWELHEFTLQSRSPFRPDIVTKLYLPASRTFSITQSIPFYLTVESTGSISLAAFLGLPFGPNSSPAQKVTRIQLMRQSVVDVRRGPKVDEIWRTDCIGEGTFSHVGDGPTWRSYSGEIAIDKQVTVTGFRAAGLRVRDRVVFSITPPDVLKSAYELREVIPVHLTTDSWSSEELEQ